MLEIISDRKIIINLENGIYTMGNESATGKTYLYKMLDKLSTRKDILCLTFSSAELIDSITNIIKKRNVKLLVLDRYDLYAGKFANEIISLRNDLIILLDYKQGSIFGEYQDICTLELTETTLEVESYGAI